MTNEVVVWDITNGTAGDSLLRGEEQWLSDFAPCPLCGRLGAFCEDTGYWYHVIAEGVFGGIPWICDRCEPDTGRWVISPPADTLPNRIPHPFEMAHG